MDRRTTAALSCCLGLLLVACVGEISENGQGGAATSGGAPSGNGAGPSGAGPNGATAGANGATNGATAANANAATASANNTNAATTDAATNAATTADASTGNGMPMCGDAACNGGETCMTCMQDCGMCVGCGDGTCAAGTEDCNSCASDCGACPTCAGAGDATTALDAEEVAFIGLLNNYRAQNGLGAVAACTSLNRAAQGHSEDMRDQDYFDHTSLSGDSPWDRMCDACYEHGCGPMTAVAENIAAGNADANGTFEQWRNSAGHNANMLGGSFTRIGIGRAPGGGQYGVYWTNVFGGDDEPSCN